MAYEQSIVIPVSLDEKTFKRFARFDMLIRRKKWVRPALFSLILIAFAFVALLTRREQSGMIAAVLLVIGLGLPLVYIGSFLSQVNVQAVRLKLSKPRRVYTVTLRDQGILIHNDQKQEEDQKLEWSQVFHVYKRKGCIYLYATPAKAFLLPDGQAEVTDTKLWSYLTDHLPAEKVSA